MRALLDRFVPLPVRAAALLPAAVLTVHQLRYQLAFGSRSDVRLAAEGHQYLASLAPLAAMLVAIGAGVFIAALARAWRDGSGLPSRAGRGFFAVWLLSAATLLAIYCGQELAEAMLSAGHPGGLAGVFGEGGLWAMPLSLLLGAALALALRVAEAAICWAGGRRVRSAPPPRRPAAAAVPFDALLVPARPLASAAAGRAPPAAAPAL